MQQHKAPTRLLDFTSTIYVLAMKDTNEDCVAEWFIRGISQDLPTGGELGVGIPMDFIRRGRKTYSIWSRVIFYFYLPWQVS